MFSILADKLQDKLLEKVYNEPALPPSNRSSTFAPLSKPVAVINREDDVNSTVRWSVLPTDKSVPLVEFWVLQMRIAGKWQTEILPRESESKKIHATRKGTLPDVIAVSALDRFRNLSPPAILVP